MGFSNFKRGMPCPICGKEDWCAYKDEISKKGNHVRYIYCHRADAEEGAVISGTDGQTYKVWGVKEQSIKCSLWGDDYKAGSAVTFTKKWTDDTIDDTCTILPACKRDEMYRFFLVSCLTLDERHRKWLQADGWSYDLIKKNRIKTMPLGDYVRYSRPDGTYESTSLSTKKIVDKMVAQFGDLKGLPGFYQHKTKEGELRWTMNNISGIVFPLYNVYGQIVALRIRKDYEDTPKGSVFMKDGKKFFKDGNKEVFFDTKGVYTLEGGKRVPYGKESGKYRPFTSYMEARDKNGEYAVNSKGRRYNRFTNGTQAQATFGFYQSKDDEPKLMIITEGEKKGMFGNNKLHNPFISLPGVTSFGKINEKLEDGKTSLQVILERGVKIFIVAFDADKATNENVMKSQDKTIQGLIKAAAELGYKIKVGVAEWDINDGKGIDDLLANGKKPRFFF